MLRLVSLALKLPCIGMVLGQVLSLVPSYTILSRYFHLAALNCNYNDVVFRSLGYHKSTVSYSLGSRPRGLGGFCLIP